MIETATAPAERYMPTEGYKHKGYRPWDINLRKNEFELVNSILQNPFIKEEGYWAEDRLNSIKDIIKHLNLPTHQISPIETEKDVEILKDVDPLFKEMINGTVYKIEEFLSRREIGYKIKLSLEKDPEIPDLEELVLSIRTNKQNYNKVSKLWDEIGDLVEGFVNEIRAKYPNKKANLDKFDENLAIEVS
ncbi:MAG: hypothetical protein ACC630_07865 [Nitrospinota bacterium]